MCLLLPSAEDIVRISGLLQTHFNFGPTDTDGLARSCLAKSTATDCAMRLGTIRDSFDA